jgi:hypothetical protein
MIYAAFFLEPPDRPEGRGTWRGWSEPVVTIELPGRLVREPSLHLYTGQLSNSYLLGKMHPESSFAAVWDPCPTCPPGMRPEDLTRVLARWRDRDPALLRYLGPATEIRSGRAELGEAAAQGLNALFAEYGLHVDATRCEPIRAEPNLTAAWSVEYLDHERRLTQAPWLVSCAVGNGSISVQEARARRRAQDDVFRRLERICSSELGAPEGTTQWAGAESWTRMYPWREITVTLTAGRLRAQRIGRAWAELGEARALLATPPVIDCSGLR